MHTPRAHRSTPAAFAVAGLAVFGLLAGCGTSGSSSSTGTSTPTTAATGGTTKGSTPNVAANSIASQLVFGAGPECPQRPFCLQGLEGTYGLKFKDVKSLDSGGKLTVAALKGNDIQVGLIFTSDGAIKANNWVLLQDDKNLQPADPVTPVVNNSVATAYGADLEKVVNDVSAKLTTNDLVELNKAVDVDKQDSKEAAESWAKSKGLIPSSTPATKSGPTIVVGSADFGESETLANIYAAVMKANGYPVETKLKIGSREVYYPQLKSGGITFFPEYAGTLLTFVDKNQSPSTDAAKTYDALTAALKNEGVTAYKASAAEDKNGFVVTEETAKKYNLKTLSDLAKPAN